MCIRDRIGSVHAMSNTGLEIQDSKNRTILNHGEATLAFAAIDIRRIVDGGKREGRFTMIENGSVFRILDFKPGVAHRMHRTDSIDYIVVMSGDIDMELDEGHSVHLKAGDVMVQRGTIHNWVNNGSETCAVSYTHLTLPTIYSV